MDLNLPGINGKQTLQEIRHTLGVTDIPAIVLSTSPGHQDEKYFSELGVPVFSKPTSLSGYEPVINILKKILGLN